MLTDVLKVVGGLFAIITIYYPDRHAINYKYISDVDLLQQLQLDYEANINLKNCSYEKSILFNHDITMGSIYQQQHFIKPSTGGEYHPETCNALFKSAIIAPYRNRTTQLEIFIKYMHSFLQNQDIWYQIFLVEQNNSLAFNRARMLNYGAKVAMEMGFQCLIFHDIDLIPINSGNIYACSKSPRHMSSSLDTFRFNLPYENLFGGAIAILADQFNQCNGMSNQFNGWGGEDDDFYRRVRARNITPCRFSPKISKYIMLRHKKEKPNEVRWQLLKSGRDKYKYDGISHLESNYVVKLKELYTHVIVA